MLAAAVAAHNDRLTRSGSIACLWRRNVQPIGRGEVNLQRRLPFIFENNVLSTPMADAR